MSARLIGPKTIEVTTNPGAAHLRVKVVLRDPGHAEPYWWIELRNTRTNDHITSDGPFYDLEKAQWAAMVLCFVAREAWSWDWKRGQLQ